MTELWKIEDEVRSKNTDIRAAFRQEQSETIVACLFDLWEKELGKVSGKSRIAEVIHYVFTRREALECFLTDGGVEIDSNIVERDQAIDNHEEKQSVCRKRGRRTDLATLATLLQTCKINSVDPLGWLSQTLSRIAQGWPVTEIEGLMPWNFKSNTID